jgi:hypothetical protein
MFQMRVQLNNTSEGGVTVAAGAGETGKAAAIAPSVAELMCTFRYLDDRNGHYDRAQFCAQLLPFGNKYLCS